MINLYSNIPHELGKRAIEYWLNKYPDTKNQRFTRELIVESLSLILENNVFRFDGEYYIQKKGCAMGTKCAPTYATLSLGYIEVLLYEKLRNTSESFAMFFKRNWKRYLDDCFIMWTKSLSDLHDFHQLLNQLEPSIQYEMKYSQCESKFLDLKVLQNYGMIH